MVFYHLHNEGNCMASPVHRRHRIQVMVVREGKVGHQDIGGREHEQDIAAMGIQDKHIVIHMDGAAVNIHFDDFLEQMGLLMSGQLKIDQQVPSFGALAPVRVVSLLSLPSVVQDEHLELV